MENRAARIVRHAKIFGRRPAFLVWSCFTKRSPAASGNETPGHIKNSKKEVDSLRLGNAAEKNTA